MANDTLQELMLKFGLNKKQMLAVLEEYRRYLEKSIKDQSAIAYRLGSYDDILAFLAKRKGKIRI